MSIDIGGKIPLCIRPTHYKFPILIERDSFESVEIGMRDSFDLQCDKSEEMDDRNDLLD